MDWMIKNGTSVNEVSQLLGHSSPVTTLSTYSYVIKGVARCRQRTGKQLDLASDRDGRLASNIAPLTPPARTSACTSERFF